MHPRALRKAVEPPDGRPQEGCVARGRSTRGALVPRAGRPATFFRPMGSPRGISTTRAVQRLSSPSRLRTFYVKQDASPDEGFQQRQRSSGGRPGKLARSGSLDTKRGNQRTYGVGRTTPSCLKRGRTVAPFQVDRDNCQWILPPQRPRRQQLLSNSHRTQTYRRSSACTDGHVHSTRHTALAGHPG